MLLIIIRIFAIITFMVLFAALLWWLSRYSLGLQKGKLMKHGAVPEDAGLRDLVSQGKLIEATDLYRQFTGVDLFTAQAVVDDLVREIRLTSRSAKEIQKLVKGKQKAAAIQVYQEETGSDFSEASAYIERLEKKSNGL